MEEDIKEVKNILENKDTKFWIGINGMQAIENILNRLEQDERVIEEMAEYIEYVSSDGDKDVMYAELYNCNQLDRDWTRGKEAEIKDILEYFRKKCE